MNAGPISMGKDNKSHKALACLALLKLSYVYKCATLYLCVHDTTSSGFLTPSSLSALASLMLANKSNAPKPQLHHCNSVASTTSSTSTRSQKCWNSAHLVCKHGSRYAIPNGIYVRHTGLEHVVHFQPAPVVSLKLACLLKVQALQVGSPAYSTHDRVAYYSLSRFACRSQ